VFFEDDWNQKISAKLQKDMIAEVCPVFISDNWQYLALFLFLTNPKSVVALIRTSINS